MLWQSTTLFEGFPTCGADIRLPHMDPQMSLQLGQIIEILSTGVTFENVSICIRIPANQPCRVVRINWLGDLVISYMIAIMKQVQLIVWFWYHRTYNTFNYILTVVIFFTEWIQNSGISLLLQYDPLCLLFDQDFLVFDAEFFLFLFDLWEF